MRSIEHSIVALLSAVALAAAAGAAAQDNQRGADKSGARPESSQGGADAGTGGRGTESAVPDTGNPGRTGSAGTAKGVPSRDPTASRGKDREAPIPGRGPRSKGTDEAAGTDSAGNPTGQSVGESIGKGAPEGRRNP